MGRTLRKRKRRLRNLVSSPEIEHLYAWIRRLGFRAACPLRLAQTPASGRGLVCLRSIHEGDVIVDLPKELLITPSRVRSDYGLARGSFSAEETLTIFVLTEKRLGESSKWRAYVRSLPDHFNSPVAFCTAGTRERLPRTLRVGVEKWKSEARRSFSRLQAYFSGTGARLSLDAFIWAWCAVNTRCIYVEGHGSTLAPFLDMLNHRWKATVHTAFANGRFTIRSGDAYAAGDEVFISYGDHDNRTLLLHYGFVLDSNPNDCVTVERHHLEKLQLRTNITSFEKKLAFLLQHQLVNAQTGFTQAGATWNLTIVLRVLQHDGTAEQWKSIHLGASTTCDCLKWERLLATEMLADYHGESVPDPMVQKLLSIEKRILLSVLSNDIDDYIHCC